MKFSSLSLFGISTLLAAAPVFALDPIVIKGSKFFNKKTGDQFYFKGVAYQPRTGVDGDMDPLADADGCKRDIEVFKDLGINSIRVYEVDYEKNHDECMKMLEDAGIYLILDMPSPKYAINRKEPHWDTDMMSHWAAKVDAFAQYSNVVAWIAGNEVANDRKTTPSAAFVKAAIRDMKAYLKAKGLDTPVGYADNDDMEIRMNLIDYFNCGDEETRADFYGVNIYRWCGDETDFKTSGYADVTKNMTGYSIPSLLTEYGCNINRPRTFPEVKSLYGSDMNEVFSGGIMYEYSEEDNKYGVVTVKLGSSKVEKNSDYANLKKVLAAAKPKGVKMSEYKPDGKKNKCPAVSSNWKVNGEVLPPTPSSAACKCMMDSLGCSLKSTELSKSEGASVGEQLGVICGLTDCDGVGYDTSKGIYGEFSTCSSTERASWIFNKNFVNQDYKGCDVDGVETKVTKSPKVKDSDVCLKEKNDLNSINPVQKKPSSSDDNESEDSDGSSKSGSKDSSGSNDSEEDNSSASTLLISLSSVALFAIATLV